jgi:hypothetical protein
VRLEFENFTADERTACLLLVSSALRFCSMPQGFGRFRQWLAGEGQRTGSEMIIRGAATITPEVIMEIMAQIGDQMVTDTRRRLGRNPDDRGA